MNNVFRVVCGNCGKEFWFINWDDIPTQVREMHYHWEHNHPGTIHIPTIDVFELVKKS